MIALVPREREPRDVDPSKHEVRSPVMARRHGVMLGSIRQGCSSAERASMKRMSEV